MGVFGIRRRRWRDGRKSEREEKRIEAVKFSSPPFSSPCVNPLCGPNLSSEFIHSGIIVTDKYRAIAFYGAPTLYEQPLNSSYVGVVTGSVLWNRRIYSVSHDYLNYKIPSDASVKSGIIKLGNKNRIIRRTLLSRAAIHPLPA